MKKQLFYATPLALLAFPLMAMEEASVQLNRDVPTYSQNDLELQGRVTAQLQARVARAMSIKTEGNDYIPVGVKILRAKAKDEVALSLDEIKKKKSTPAPSLIAESRKKIYVKAFSYNAQPHAPMDQASKPVNPGSELEALINALDVPPYKPTSEEFITIIGELEKLTRKGFKEAGIFSTKDSEPSADFETLLETINSKTDAIYTFKNKCKDETLEHPAITRLQALVTTMSASNGKLVKANAKLEHNPSFVSYKVCVESLQTMLTKIKSQK